MFQTKAEVSASFLPACALARSFTRQNFPCQPSRESRAQGTYHRLPMQQIPLCHDGIMESEDKWKQLKTKNQRVFIWLDCFLRLVCTKQNPRVFQTPIPSVGCLDTCGGFPDPKPPGDSRILNHHSESDPSWKSVAMEFTSSSFDHSFHRFPSKSLSFLRSKKRSHISFPSNQKTFFLKHWQGTVHLELKSPSPAQRHSGKCRRLWMTKWSISNDTKLSKSKIWDEISSICAEKAVAARRIISKDPLREVHNKLFSQVFNDLSSETYLFNAFQPHIFNFLDSPVSASPSKTSQIRGWLMANPQLSGDGSKWAQNCRSSSNEVFKGQSSSFRKLPPNTWEFSGNKKHLKHGRKMMKNCWRSHKTRKHPSTGVKGARASAAAWAQLEPSLLPQGCFQNGTCNAEQWYKNEKWECLKICAVPRSFCNVQHLCNIVGNNWVLGHPIQKTHTQMSKSETKIPTPSNVAAFDTTQGSLPI